MPSNFIANGFTSLEKEVKQRVKNKYQADLKNADFIKKFKIRRKIKLEIAIELFKKRKEISRESLFIKK